MNRDFIPSRDADLLAWSANYASLITATPTAFGLTAPQATAYTALHTAFATALETATEPSTRTRSAISIKNDSRRVLVAEARVLARIINAFPDTTNAMRLDLGLNERDNEPTPINPPETAPVVEILSTNGRRMRLQLRGAGMASRGKPDGVDGATVMTFVGEEPPADVSQWKFEGSTTKTIFDVEFPATVPAGSKVWYSCFWFNPRAQSGPASTPISAYIAGGLVGAIAA